MRSCPQSVIMKNITSLTKNFLGGFEMKHLKRRLTAAILSVLLATSSFTAAPISVTAATTEETEAGECIGANDVADETPKSGITGDCTWELDEEGTLTISGNGCMENYNDTSFQSRWAHWRGSIKSIIIRKGVTGIGDYAFLDVKILPM